MMMKVMIKKILIFLKNNYTLKEVKRAKGVNCIQIEEIKDKSGRAWTRTMNRRGIVRALGFEPRTLEV